MEFLRMKKMDENIPTILLCRFRFEKRFGCQSPPLVEHKLRCRRAMPAGSPYFQFHQRNATFFNKNLQLCDFDRQISWYAREVAPHTKRQGLHITRSLIAERGFPASRDTEAGPAAS